MLSATVNEMCSITDMTEELCEINLVSSPFIQYNVIQNEEGELCGIAVLLVLLLTLVRAVKELTQPFFHLHSFPVIHSGVFHLVSWVELWQTIQMNALKKMLVRYFRVVGLIPLHSWLHVKCCSLCFKWTFCRDSADRNNSSGSCLFKCMYVCMTYGIYLSCLRSLHWKPLVVVPIVSTLHQQQWQQ